MHLTKSQCRREFESVRDTEGTEVALSNTASLENTMLQYHKTDIKYSKQFKNTNYLHYHFVLSKIKLFTVLEVYIVLALTIRV